MFVCNSSVCNSKATIISLFSPSLHCFLSWVYNTRRFFTLNFILPCASISVYMSESIWTQSLLLCYSFIASRKIHRLLFLLQPRPCVLGRLQNCIITYVTATSPFCQLSPFLFFYSSPLDSSFSVSYCMPFPSWLLLYSLTIHSQKASQADYYYKDPFCR